MAQTSSRGDSAVFVRPAGAAAGGLGAAVGAFLFLGMAGLFLLGVIAQDLPIRIFGALGFGFFGVLMAANAASALSRGGDPRVAEVAPEGLWLREMGRLAWRDIAEVRLERARVGVGRYTPGTRQYRRLGVVPRDPSIRPSAATRAADTVNSAYLSLVRAFAPEVRVGGDAPAPFGVSEIEVPKDFERLLVTIAAYVVVRDASQDRASRVAGRWSSSDGGVASQPVAPAQGGSTMDLGAIVAAAHATQPRATFARPAVRPLAVALAVIPIVALLTIVVPAVLPKVVDAGPSWMFGILILGFFGVLILGPSAKALVGLARQARSRGDHDSRLRVGPDGIWTPAGGLVSWPDVHEVRTERVGWVRQIGRPAVERWRLSVVTAGGTSGVNSDELDARFDDVLDLVRFYHPVVERT